VGIEQALAIRVDGYDAALARRTDGERQELPGQGRKEAGHARVGIAERGELTRDVPLEFRDGNRLATGERVGPRLDLAITGVGEALGESAIELLLVERRLLLRDLAIEARRFDRAAEALPRPEDLAPVGARHGRLLEDDALAGVLAPQHDGDGVGRFAAAQRGEHLDQPQAERLLPAIAVLLLAEGNDLLRLESVEGDQPEIALLETHADFLVVRLDAFEDGELLRLRDGGEQEDGSEQSYMHG